MAEIVAATALLVGGDRRHVLDRTVRSGLVEVDGIAPALRPPADPVVPGAADGPGQRGARCTARSPLHCASSPSERCGTGPPRRWGPTPLVADELAAAADRAIARGAPGNAVDALERSAQLSSPAAAPRAVVPRRDARLRPRPGRRPGTGCAADYRELVAIRARPAAARVAGRARHRRPRRATAGSASSSSPPTVPTAFGDDAPRAAVPARRGAALPELRPRPERRQHRHRRGRAARAGRRPRVPGRSAGLRRAAAARRRGRRPGDRGRGGRARCHHGVRARPRRRVRRRVRRRRGPVRRCGGGAARRGATAHPRHRAGPAVLVGAAPRPLDGRRVGGRGGGRLCAETDQPFWQAYAYAGHAAAAALRGQFADGRATSTDRAEAVAAPHGFAAADAAILVARAAVGCRPGPHERAFDAPRPAAPTPATPRTIRCTGSGPWPRWPTPRPGAAGPRQDGPCSRGCGRRRARRPHRRFG